MVKQRVQCNWKFKENETDEFYEWFENQSNISNSLRSMLYHVIELYGTGDVLNPDIQKEFVKTSLIMESLRGKNVIQVDTQGLEVQNQKVPQFIFNKESGNIVAKKPVEVIAVEKNSDNKNNDSFYGDIDQNNI